MFSEVNKLIEAFEALEVSCPSSPELLALKICIEKLKPIRIIAYGTILQQAVYGLNKDNMFHYDGIHLHLVSPFFLEGFKRGGYIAHIERVEGAKTLVAICEIFDEDFKWLERFEERNGYTTELLETPFGSAYIFIPKYRLDISEDDDNFLKHLESDFKSNYHGKQHGVLVFKEYIEQLE
jgi:hypothetical protein